MAQPMRDYSYEHGPEEREAVKDLVVSWLNDAYSMEKALIPVLENHAKDCGDAHPQMRRRIEQHIDETRRHADMVQDCLKRLNEDVSSVKGGWGSLLGQLKSVSTGMFQDELIKNCLSDFAAENFEIASYQSLIAAADYIGDESIARDCRQILSEEEAMARWIEQQIPIATEEALNDKARARRS